jgi:hypothetical protein
MEEDLDAPIGPYDREDDDHDQNRLSTVDILEEKAELWEPKSGTFQERKLPRSYTHDEVEIVPVRLYPMAPAYRYGLADPPL